MLSSVFVPCSSSSLTNLSCIGNLQHTLLAVVYFDVYRRSAFWHVLQLIVSSPFLACADTPSFFSVFAGALQSFSALPLQLLPFFVLPPVATHKL